MSLITLAFLVTANKRRANSDSQKINKRVKIDACKRDHRWINR